MATYTETKATLDEIAVKTNDYRKMLDRAKSIIDQAVSGLNQMSTDYFGFSSQLNTDAAANPTDEAWQTALAEKNQMVADFQAQKTRGQNMQSAVSGL